MPFPYGTQVVAGTNAVANDHNNGRKDGLTRWLKFEVTGAIFVSNGVGGSFLMPFAGTVVKAFFKLSAGTATIRLKSGSNTVESGISVTSTAGTDDTLALPAIAANDLFTLDVTATTGGQDLVVMVEVLPTP